MKNNQKNVSIGIIILCLIFGLTTLFWLYYIVGAGNARVLQGKLFEFGIKPYLTGVALLPLIGGFLGLASARGWGWWSSSIGRSLIFISIGTAAFGGGMIMWNYYLFFKGVEVPYPSMADIFFGSCPLFWTIGIVLLLRSTGAKYAVKKTGGKLLVTLLPAIVILVSYYLLFIVARNGTIDVAGGKTKLFFDFYYPIGDAILLSLTILTYKLTKKYIGGIFKKAMPILLLGFFMMYFADFLFVYMTTKGSYFNGSISDFLYTVTFFILGLGLAQFNPKRLRVPPTKEKSWSIEK
ncbi:MAG: hypothetical protein U0517_02440 [Candidatus Andersenbacteria bacterium]